MRSPADRPGDDPGDGLLPGFTADDPGDPGGPGDDGLDGSYDPAYPGPWRD